ncbi:hypothetical protein Bca52824_063975 [Brassica carinata]|uniref:Helicase ATP-binding domain-containing protein n=2 Tax=Brassica TaxID=3705 RepID=A0A8X7QFR1_BRACI|nr:hypothetical protein Bca52824_063975 [Brassica carinata]
MGHSNGDSPIEQKGTFDLIPTFVLRLLIYAIDMVVGTPGRILQHIEEGNMVYGDIAYLVLDEADTMFDRGFGPDIRKFLAPLKQRALKTNDHGFQTVLVTDTRISIWASS